MTSRVEDSNKINALIMGRKTYFGIPPSKRPLPGRLNIVLSRTSTSSEYPSDVILCTSLNDAMEKLHTEPYVHRIENIWIVGGTAVYKEAMDSKHCHRVYFTEIKEKFECDTFFPTIPKHFRLISNDDANVPSNVQEENGIKYEYKIYENVN